MNRPNVSRSSRSRRSWLTITSAAASAASVTLLTACVPLLLPFAPADPVPSAPIVPMPSSSTVNIEAFSISHQWDQLSEPQEYNVVCGRGQESFYPGDMDAACSWLSENYEALANYQLGTICTEQYGGPELATVHVVQTDGAVSSFVLQRTNGCYID